MLAGFLTVRCRLRRDADELAGVALAHVELGTRTLTSCVQDPHRLSSMLFGLQIRGLLNLQRSGEVQVR